MRAWLLLIALALPGATVAEPAPVQSGEHAAFSRLVVILRGSEWAVSQRGREVILDYPGHKDGFDTSTVFARMPRSRIERIDTDDSQMRLTLNCDCAVSTFLEKEAYVVIDVADTVQSLSTPPIVPDPDPEAPEDTRLATASAPQTRTPGAESPSIGLDLPDVAFDPAFSAPSEPLSETAQHVLEDVESRLAGELETAALRGVLNPSPGTALPAGTRPQVTLDDRATPADRLLSVPNPDHPLANMRITSSRDIPGPLRAASQNLADGGRVCPPDADYDVAAWGSDTPFAAQIGAARQDLYGELDRLDHDVALRLTRSYIYFGFGAEALDILSLDPELARGQAHLTALARIMDGEKPRPDGPLSGLGECDGPVALWAALALPDPPAGALPQSDPALRALNALPEHLRQQLAPALSRVLLSYGDPKGASSALRSLERLPAELPAAAKLAKAQVTMQGGDMEAGTQQLSEVVDENAEQSPEALIALVDAKIAQNQPISAEVASLVEAYASELRGSDLGPALRRTHVIALIKSGQFDRAYAEADTLGANADEPEANALRRLMLRELVGSASDIMFLDHAFDVPSRDLRGLREDDLAALAARYLDLGFASRAERAISLIADRNRAVPTRLLAARISMAMAKPYKAQADLLGLDSPEADLLRADAKRMAGAHSEARALYARAERAEAVRDTALLAGDLAALAPEIASPTIDPADGDGMLSRSTALLEQTTQARQSLAALLDQADLRSDPDN